MQQCMSAVLVLSREPEQCSLSFLVRTSREDSRKRSSNQGNVGGKQKRKALQLLTLLKFTNCKEFMPS